MTVTAPFLQSGSLREPMMGLEGADYSAFDRFWYAPGTEPTYLEEHYGITTPPGTSSFDIGKVLREHLSFVDSEDNEGVQVADLLSSGARRCLRGEFADNLGVAALLGKLMVQREKPLVPMQIVALGAIDSELPDDTAQVLRAMKATARSMVLTGGRKQSASGRRRLVDRQ